MLLKIPALILNKIFNKENNASVLYFHRVLDGKSEFYPDDPTKDEFEKLILQLKKVFDIVPLKDIQKQQQKSGKPKMSITFDDGYYDNLSNAAPLLEKHNIPATFFVSSKGLEEGILWQDRLVHIIKCCDEKKLNNIFGITNVNQASKVLGEFKYMDFKSRDMEISKISDEVCAGGHYPNIMLTGKDLIKLNKSPLFDIGGHTHSHVILSSENDEDAFDEIKKDKEIIESILGEKITLFCYPNGIPGVDFNDKHMEMVYQLGYEVACSTKDGGVNSKSNPLSINRFLPYRKTPKLRTLSAIKIAGEKSE